MKKIKKIMLSAGKRHQEQLEASVSLLAKAYAFAKAGREEEAGQLFVEASENDVLDELMETIASSFDVEDEDEYEDLELGASGDDDSEDDNDNDNDNDDDDDDEMEETVIDNVELPASVARLAARSNF